MWRQLWYDILFKLGTTYDFSPLPVLVYEVSSTQDFLLFSLSQCRPDVVFCLAEERISPIGQPLMSEAISLQIKEMQPSSKRTAAWESVERRVQAKLRAIWPDALVARYGSSITGLCDRDSDIDMAILLPSMPQLKFIEASEQVLAMYQCLAGWEAIEQLEVIPKARVPIVCFVDVETGLTCDICVNNTSALCNTALIQSALVRHPPLLSLVQAMRVWTSARGLRNVEDSLSSYTWTLLCMNFLIQAGHLPKIDIHAAGIDLSTTSLARDLEHLRQQTDRLLGVKKRRREEECGVDPGSKETVGSAELFFGLVKHLASGIDYRRHEVVTLRKEAPFYQNDGPWECGKHAPPRLRVEDPVELNRNLGIYLTKRTQSWLQVESARACVLIADGASWYDVVSTELPIPRPKHGQVADAAEGHDSDCEMDV